MKKIVSALLLAFFCVSYVAAVSRLKAGDRIVTLGDSITQAGGYQVLMQKVLARFYPDLGVEIVNAGIGGHKSPDMAARLQKDVIDKKPTIVTVSCGVNDVWHDFYNPPRGVDLGLIPFDDRLCSNSANTSAAIYWRLPLSFTKICEGQRT
jgi:lysophospholipase L1-like esterase